jgi:ankyrin repeat protein
MRARRLTLGIAAAIGLSLTVSAQSPSPVADAARKGDAAAVKALLKQGADVNAPQADGMTALHWASERGDIATADALLYAGAGVASVTRLGGYTPLHLASRTGSAPVVKALLKAGAGVATLTTSGATALHLAASSGNAESVSALLDAKADINAKETESGQTPLIFAVAQGHTDVMKVLIKRGADVNIPTKVVNLQQLQAMDRQGAAIRRQIMAASVARGGEPTASQQQAAVQAAREFYATGKVPEPPAAGAAGGGRGGGRGGGAPDAGAAPAGPPAGPPQAFQGRGGGGAGGGQTATDLQNAEAPPPPVSAKGGLTALHHAARNGYTAAALPLIEAGADINKKAADGNTPLLMALINGQFDFAMLLVEKGANPNIAGDGYAMTPLWAVINTQWQPRTRFPQPQEMDYQKATYLDVMKALLEAGADVDARVKGHPWYMTYTGCGNGNCGLANVTGSTAFWRAAYGTDVEAMKLLVKYGADPNIPTMAGGGGRGGGGGGGRGGGAAGRGGGGGGGAGGGPDGPGGAQPAAAQQAAGRGGPGGPPQGAGRGGPGGGDPSGLPPTPAGGPGVYPLHAAAGAEYGEGFAGNAHRHAPDSWLASVKYLVEVLGADVNMRDDGGYTPMHHAAARGDNETILYLVSKGADVKAVSRRGQTTADMANGPVSRISPYPETIALLVKLGAINNNRCQSCVP